jgi:hypothetical protein
MQGLPQEVATDGSPGGGPESRLWAAVAGRGQEPERPGQTENNLAAITQAGGWKSTRMPLQYAEKINAARSGMARAAEKSGRDSIEDDPAREPPHRG